MSLVVPAVLPSSRKDLEEKLALFTRLPSVNRVQIDVVDGEFASPASWPYSAPAELEALVERGDMLPQLDRIAYEIDLMCLDADRVASAWLSFGATRLTFHAESVTDVPQLLASVRSRYGNFISLGLAINIASDPVLIEQNLGEIRYVQFMGIARIGRQGQPFDERVFEKVRIFHEQHPEIPVQVDGGVSLKNASRLLALGVSSLIIGSALARAGNSAAALAVFEELQSPYGV